MAIRNACLEANPNIASRGHYYSKKIRLADVLLALQNKRQDFIPDATLSLLCQHYWDLKKDTLDDQPKDTCIYLAELIKKYENI